MRRRIAIAIGLGAVSIFAGGFLAGAWATLKALARLGREHKRKVPRQHQGHLHVALSEAAWDSYRAAGAERARRFH